MAQLNSKRYSLTHIRNSCRRISCSTPLSLVCQPTSCISDCGSEFRCTSLYLQGTNRQACCQRLMHCILCSSSQTVIHRSNHTLTHPIHMPKAGRLILISRGNYRTGLLLRELACHYFQNCFREKLPKGTQCFCLGWFSPSFAIIVVPSLSCHHCHARLCSIIHSTSMDC